MFLKNILKLSKSEELLKNHWTSTAICSSKKFIYLYNKLERLGLNEIGDESVNGNFIWWGKNAYWNYAIALNQARVQITSEVNWQIGIDFLAWLIKELRQTSEERKNIPLGVETNIVLNYIHKLRENLNKSIVFNNVCAIYHNCLDSLGKLKARYYRPYQEKFNIFYCGTVTKFINSKCQQLKIYELLDSNVYKIIFIDKEISIKCVPRYLLENLFIKETFTGNDVITWLPGFDWEIYIFPLLYCLVIKSTIFLVTSSGRHCYEVILYPKAQFHLITICL